MPYIVTADVTRAFDSIDITRLTSLIQPVVAQPEYHVVRWVRMSRAEGVVLNNGLDGL